MTIPGFRWRQAIAIGYCGMSVAVRPNPRSPLPPRRENGRGGYSQTRVPWEGAPRPASWRSLNGRALGRLDGALGLVAIVAQQPEIERAVEIPPARPEQDDLPERDDVI